jgi:thioredoxin reductase (NADPH)
MGGGGENRLEWLAIQNRENGEKRRVNAEALFVLIGAVLGTAWLPDEIARDQWGFVVTGRGRGL